MARIPIRWFGVVASKIVLAVAKLDPATGQFTREPHPCPTSLKAMAIYIDLPDSMEAQ